MVITLCYRPVRAVKDQSHWLIPHMKKMGWQLRQRDDGPVVESSDDILWILDNANWFPKTCRGLMNMEEQARPFTMIWHTEPLPPPRESEIPLPGLTVRELVKIVLRDRRATDAYTNYKRLKSLHKKAVPALLTVSSKGRKVFLSEHGISAHFLPMGWSPNVHDHYEGGAKDIDVLFLGDRLVPRRKRCFRKLQKESIPLQSKGSWYDSECWGENRKKLLNRAKILLNIQRYKGDLSGYRLIQGMANKALVISEPIYKPEPYKPGVHYVSAPMDEMADTIRYYLSNTEERNKIVNAGYQLVTKELTIENTLKMVCSLIKEMRQTGR